MSDKHRDEDAHKGAVEDDSVNADPKEQNTSLRGQNPHRGGSSLADGQDTDYPEPGENAEHTGEPEQDPEQNPEVQSSGERQKTNQNWRKEDLLAG